MFQPQEEDLSLLASSGMPGYLDRVFGNGRRTGQDQGHNVLLLCIHAAMLDAGFSPAWQPSVRLLNRFPVLKYFLFNCTLRNKRRVYPEKRMLLHKLKLLASPINGFVFFLGE